MTLTEFYVELEKKKTEYTWFIIVAVNPLTHKIKKMIRGIGKTSEVYSETCPISSLKNAPTYSYNRICRELNIEDAILIIDVADDSTKNEIEVWRCQDYNKVKEIRQRLLEILGLEEGEKS